MEVSKMFRRDDLDLLGLPDDPSEAAIKFAFKHAVFKHHPDHGGDPAVFAALDLAYRRCLQAAASQVCRACDGAGTRYAPAGLGRLAVVCDLCGGSGKFSEKSLTPSDK